MLKRLQGYHGAYKLSTLSLFLEVALGCFIARCFFSPYFAILGEYSIRVCFILTLRYDSIFLFISKFAKIWILLLGSNPTNVVC